MSFKILVGFLGVLFAFEYVFKPLLSFLWILGLIGIFVYLGTKAAESLKEYAEQSNLIQTEYQRWPEAPESIPQYDPDHPLYIDRE